MREAILVFRQGYALEDLDLQGVFERAVQCLFAVVGETLRHFARLPDRRLFMAEDEAGAKGQPLAAKRPILRPCEEFVRELDTKPSRHDEDKFVAAPQQGFKAQRPNFLFAVAARKLEIGVPIFAAGARPQPVETIDKQITLPFSQIIREGLDALD